MQLLHTMDLKNEVVLKSVKYYCSLRFTELFPISPNNLCWKIELVFFPLNFSGMSVQIQTVSQRYLVIPK